MEKQHPEKVEYCLACHEIFDYLQHKKVIIPCGHLYCLKCMSLVSLEDDNYFCIGCLVEIEFTQEFKNNIKTLLNAQKEQKTESKHPEATNAHLPQFTYQVDELPEQVKHGVQRSLNLDQQKMKENQQESFAEFLNKIEQKFQQKQDNQNQSQFDQLSPVSQQTLDQSFLDKSFVETQASFFSNQSIKSDSKKQKKFYKEKDYIIFFSLIINKEILDKMNHYPQVKLLNLRSSSDKKELRVMHTFEDETTYLGEWNIKTNEREGQGMIISKDGSIYGGEWKDGKLSGTGLLIYLSGDVYEGEWSEGLRQGSGTYYFKDGGNYRGQWLNGQMHGQGILTWQNEDQYVGLFVYNQRSGNGKLKFANGDQYIGQFQSNFMHGQGVYLWNDGRKYEGTFKNGQLYGQGSINYINGDKYEGEIIDGKREGLGIFTPQSGLPQSGNWKNDEKVEQCLIF
eukprot:403347615